MAADTIVVNKIKKSFGKVDVLKGVSFKVRKGTILALLGPNGAGKTTTVKILSTLLDADGGSVTVNGYDTRKDAAEVRASIGLTGQYSAVDEYLTGQENLELIGRLYRLGKAESSRRATSLIEQFDLVEASKRPVKTYSGGMKRRLDLAMSLIADPPIIFLDEPTTGLDPRSRQTMWSMIRSLVDNGTTILLTTQYMEEADQLADQIIVIDGGKVIAEGTATELKSKVGSDRLELTISRKSSFEKAKQIVDGDSMQADAESRTLSIATKRGVATLEEVLSKLKKANIKIEGISFHQPTLDDVFLSLTGHATTIDETEGGKK